MTKLVQKSGSWLLSRVEHYRVEFGSLIRSALGPPPNIDVLLVALLVVAACSLTIWGLSQFPDGLYSTNYNDVWFDADPPRVFENLLARTSDHFRTSVHPLFSILVYPLAKLLKSLGMPPLMAMQALVVCASGLTTTAIYLGVRALANSSVAAAVFTAVFVASATHIFWFSLVETYPFAALSIATMFAVMVRADRTHQRAWILGSAFTLAITVTNWTFGLAATLFNLTFGRFVRVSVAALVIVMVLATLQAVIFPTSKLFFLPKAMLGEVEYSQVGERIEWTPLADVRSLFIFGAVAPPVARERLDGAVVLSNQRATLQQLSFSGIVALISWIALLGLGAWGAYLSVSHRPVVFALLLFMAGQLVLHLVYGNITFLYSADFLPVLVCFSAFGTFTPYRNWSYAAAILFVLFAGFNNLQQFHRAVAMGTEIVKTCETNRKGPCSKDRPLW